MRIVELGDVNNNQGRDPPAGPWVACSIGPDSLVDTVIVDGVTLGPRAVLPCGYAPRVERVRGPRTGSTADNINNRCQLMLYTAADLVPAVAAPRRPVAVAGVWPGGVVAAKQRLVRLPFAGRLFAAFYLQGVTGSSFDYVVRGIKYRAPGSALAAHTSDLTDTTFAVTDSGTGNGDDLSLTLLVGGSDQFEKYDELELWFGQAGAGVFSADAEAFDFGGQ